MSDEENLPGAARNYTDEGALTQQFLGLIGQRIRALRTQQSLTVQQLADQAGISRRLMTQIELGQANPSLVTVTRIARQLGTETTELLAGEALPAPVEVHGAETHVVVWSSSAGSTARLLESTRHRRADLRRWELLPGDSYRGHPDPPNSQELFYVTAGTLTLRADDHEVTIAPGGSARLNSDRAYTYRNDGDRPCVFLRTVSLTT